MKKNQFLTFILATTLWTIGTEAQPSYKSTIVRLHSNTTDKVLVCQHQSRYVVTYYHNTGTGEPHYFTVQDMLTGTTKQFPVDPYPSPSPGVTLHPTSLEINDMKVSDNGVCWFCGKKCIEIGGTYYPGMGWVPQTDDYGVVGYFSLSDVLDGGDSYHLFVLSGTENLTRIEPRGINYFQTFMIGKPKDNSHVSCLAGIGIDLTYSNWEYDIVYPSNSDEVFTDVVDGGEGIIVVSRYGGDNYHIGLRHTKRGPLYNAVYRNVLNSCNKYDMQTVLTPYTGNIAGWRRDTDPILLSSFGDNVTMSHSCDNTAKGIVSYKIYINNPGDVRVNYPLIAKYSSYIKLLDCYSYPVGNKTAFLANDINRNKWAVLSIDWSQSYTLPYDYYSTVACPKSSYTWKGLASFGLSPVFTYINGFKSDYTPCHDAYRNGITMASTCIPDSTTYIIIDLSNPTFSSGDGITTDNDHLEQIVIPTSHDFISSTITTTTICTTY